MHISSSYTKILGETNFHTREIPRSGSKAKDSSSAFKKSLPCLYCSDGNSEYTPGTAGGPKKNIFVCIYLLVMPKYWGKQIFTHGRFPKVGQKQKNVEKKERGKRERLNDGNNNGQATHGARKHAWRTQAA